MSLRWNLTHTKVGVECEFCTKSSQNEVINQCAPAFSVEVVVRFFMRLYANVGHTRGLPSHSSPNADISSKLCADRRSFFYWMTFENMSEIASTTQSNSMLSVRSRRVQGRDYIYLIRDSSTLRMWNEVADFCLNRYVMFINLFFSHIDSCLTSEKL